MRCTGMLVVTSSHSLWQGKQRVSWSIAVVVAATVVEEVISIAVVVDVSGAVEVVSVDEVVVRIVVVGSAVVVVVCALV